MSRKPDYEVFSVKNYGGEGAEEKAFWTKIGAAWENRDGSINVELTALPLDGRLNIRKPREQEQGGEGEGGNPTPAAKKVGGKK